MPKITALETHDLRFPTSRELDGSDAMVADPDYSAAYVIVRTDAGDGHAGHGFAFTIGRGNEVQVAAIDAYAPLLVGRDLDEVLGDMRATWRLLVRDSQLRWLGPEKGVVHMAVAAIVNALWDLRSRREGLPLWKLLADLSPAELVELVDFTYLADVLEPAAAVALLEERADGRAVRERSLRADGLPAYTTSAGWLGYDDAKVRRLTLEAVAAGFTHVKLKVGLDEERDLRRVAIAREALGPELRLMIDANQIWDVPTAIRRMERLARFDIHWLEEPTSPDDVVGHAAIARAIAPVRVATGEHAANRVVFKQLLQLDAIGFCQIDACRLGGVNEVLAVLLLAAHFGVPVCPHAGGVGLCELVQHLAAVDYVAIGASLDERVVEYVDHLHQHFVDPCVVERGRYRAPSLPGYSSELKPETVAAHAFPDGAAWR